MAPIPLLKYHLDVQKAVLRDFLHAVPDVVHSADPCHLIEWPASERPHQGRGARRVPQPVQPDRRSQ